MFNLVILVVQEVLALPWGHPRTNPAHQDSQGVLAALVHHRALGLLLHHIFLEAQFPPWLLVPLYNLKMTNEMTVIN